MYCWIFDGDTEASVIQPKRPSVLSSTYGTDNEFACLNLYGQQATGLDDRPHHLLFQDGEAHLEWAIRPAQWFGHFNPMFINAALTQETCNIVWRSDDDQIIYEGIVSVSSNFME